MKPSSVRNTPSAGCDAAAPAIQEAEVGGWPQPRILDQSRQHDEVCLKNHKTTKRNIILLFT
jgi:hypothetical protein